MTTPNELTVQDTVVGSDRFVIYSVVNGQTRTATGTAVADFANSADTGKVNRTGDTMSGALNVPAGAFGTQVPQAQEVVNAAALAASSGSSLVGHIAAGVGAVFRWLRDKLRENVSVKDYGAVGDGATNDAAAFLAACVSLGAKGGIVRYYDKHLIDTSFTVPPNVGLRGPMLLVGTPGSNAAAAYGNMAGLIINSAASITLSSGAGHEGGLVYRKGMTFPAADASAFAGTAFTAGGDDCFLINSQVLGFNLAYASNNFQRPRVFNNHLDNAGGLSIDVCFDIAHVHDNHAWPFASIAAAGGASRLHRGGTAYSFANVGDWNKSTNNFSYGYFRGLVVNNCNSMTLLSSSHDNTGSHAGAMGIEILGTSTDTRIVAGQAAAQGTGIHINTAANTHTSVSTTHTWSNTDHGILIDGGDVTVSGGRNRNSPNGITVNNAASKVLVEGVRFDATPNPILCNVATTNVRVGKNDYGDLAAGSKPVVGALTLPVVASAGTVALPATGDDFNISGAVNIGTITGGFAGRAIRLFFTGAPIVLHAIGTDNIRLNGAVNFAAAAGFTLTLEHNGTQWYEMGRSA